MSEKHIKRFSDSDAMLLRYMAKHYGIDGLCHEVWRLLAEWRAQNPTLYGALAKAANRLAFASKLAVGKAPSPRSF